MQVMYRNQITIVCETAESIKAYTDAVLNFIAMKRDEKDFPGFVGCEAMEDDYLIADEETIEADKAAYLLVKKEPVKIPVAAVNGVSPDLTRVKVVEEPIVVEK